MFQANTPDPTKGFMPIRPKLHNDDPTYISTEITRQKEDQIFLFESIGVFILVFGANSFKSYINTDFHFVVAIVMAFVMAASGSNGNFNPALTLGFCLRNSDRYPKHLFWLYFKAQVCGAFAAYFALYMLNDYYQAPLAPSQHTSHEYFRIIMSQMIGVFVLVLCFLQITSPNTCYTTSLLQKFLMMGVYAYLGYKLCPGSGYASNAAFGAARAVFGIFFCNFQGLKYFILWAIGDALGVLLAVTFYNNLVEVHVVARRLAHIRDRQRQEQEDAIQLLNIQKQK